MSIELDTEGNQTLKKEIVTQPEMKLVGISIRTSNAAEFNPETAQIGPTVQKYISEGIYNQIANQKNPGTTLCVYTDYESDHTGKFTYFIGAQVDADSDVPEGLSRLTIPAQAYAKFTTDAGVMPSVCINAWMDIWKMTPEDFGSERAFKADFEVYDHRAMTPENTALDIYIGIKQ
ncbi:MAG: AraC family transcriptional regulator [Alphaproteobacteria bacterium]|nr:AraC family transcriptional regulator [Alphaproteobacteria bacterium]